MSWAAHELESYFIQKHTKVRVSYLAILLGCLLPDLFTKLPVYGFSIGSFTLKAHDPAQYQRGWPGAGFTHSLMFGVVFALIVLKFSGSRSWFIGIILGQWAHVLTDVFDSVGTMVFFPFTTQHYSIGMWAYAAQQGRYGDAAAYYSSFGGVWDFFWLCAAITGWSVFSGRFFFSTVVPNDGAWAWLRQRFSMSQTAMLALYRAYFVYGGARIFGWFIYARLGDGRPLDWHWGGPFWVHKIVTHYGAAGGIAIRTTIGVLGLSACLGALWWLVGRRLWSRGGEPAPVPSRVMIPKEGRADLLIYLAAALSLIGFGAWLKTPVLNWIVGPAYVVSFVVTVTPLVDRLRARRRRTRPLPSPAAG